MFNSKQVEELFRENAIMIDGEDVMPFSRAVRLGGPVGDLVFKATHPNIDPEKHLKFFGDFNTDYHIVCFTFEGFQFFISYANLFEVNGIRETKPVKTKETKDGKVIDICADLTRRAAAGNMKKPRKKAGDYKGAGK